MSNLIYFNGDIIPAHEARVSIYDYGFLYGDGVFEGMRVYDRRVFRLVEHMDRLIASIRATRLPLAATRDELCEIVRRTCAANDIDSGYIRMQVTRGVGPVGLDPLACDSPTVLCTPCPIGLYPEEAYARGLSIITVPTRRNGNEALSPKIKSLNYMNNIMAKLEASSAGFGEAIMLSGDGYVAECSSDNLFIVSRGVLRTPDPAIGLLDGVTRNAVIELAKDAGKPVQEGLLTRYDVFVADECFITGTAAEIVPVVAVDGRPIGAGAVGPYTKEIMAAYQTLVHTEGEPYDRGDNR